MCHRFERKEYVFMKWSLFMKWSMHKRLGIFYMIVYHEIQHRMLYQIKHQHRIGTRTLCGVLISMVYFMGGCGADTDQSEVSPYSNQEFDSITDMQMQEDRDDEQAGEEIDGTLERFEAPEVWARQNIMIGLAELPAFGIVLSETRTTLRTTITKKDGVIISREETCKIVIDRPDASAVETTIPQAFINSISLFDRALTMEGNTLNFAQVVQVQGAHLRDPISDILPTQANDPRIFDQDQDGQPGLTVLVSGILEGNVQVIQRLTTQLSGELDGDEMEGILTWKTEEPVLNGSDQILAQDIPITVHPTYQSYFVARRVKRDVTCADILAESDTIFWTSELDQRK